jgi:hypothetical protein
MERLEHPLTVPPDPDIPSGSGRVGKTALLQQIWNTVHGAVTLELQGLVLTPDPEATYRATLDTLLRGLGPAAP